MTVGGFFSALVVGAIIGYLGRWLAPKSRPRAQLGLLLTILLGVVAALVGTAVAHGLHEDRFVTTFPIQVVMAALFVTLFGRLASGRRG
jgi:uncharacterized membrane protein YeaQ/YmgE (transglycosylase-associated protein family)